MTTTERTRTITMATATRQGTEVNNADAAAVFATEMGDTGAAVIDLAGHHPNAPFVARLLAETAARIAPQRGGPAGLLSAGLLVADAGAAAQPEPDGVAVVAVAQPDGQTVISWIGDSHAYGWNGTRLHRYTTPHTYGQQLREHGAPWEIAAAADHWLTTTLGRATPAGILTVTCHDPLIILASDGIDSIPAGELEAIVRDFAHEPQALADSIVAAAQENGDGYRDDATVVVIHVPE
jgi:serine/threonine protein phosphatase PrpC